MGFLKNINRKEHENSVLGLYQDAHVQLFPILLEEEKGKIRYQRGLGQNIVHREKARSTCIVSGDCCFSKMMMVVVMMMMMILQLIIATL